MPRYIYDPDNNPVTEQDFAINKEVADIQATDNPQSTFARTLDSIRQTNPNIDKTLQDFGDPKDDDFDFKGAIDILNKRESVRHDIERVIEEDPTLYGPLKDLILDKGKQVGKTALFTIDQVSRALNFVTAREVGLATGLVRHMRGTGSVLGAYQEAVKDNRGFADFLAEVGFPEGPALSKAFGLGPFAVGTTRFGAGLALDIALDPLTYLSFGTNVPKKAVDASGRAAARSVARFAGKTLLTDKALLKGITAAKATPAGQALLRGLDAFAASHLGRTAGQIANKFGEAFIAGFGQNKAAYKLLRKAERIITTGREEIPKTIQKLWEGIDGEKRLIYFTQKFNFMKEEAAFREGLKNAGKTGDDFVEAARKFGRRKFNDPQLDLIDDALYNETDGLMFKLARDAGLPEEILFQNYIHSSFQEITKSTIKGARKGELFKKTLKTKATLKKEFVEANLVKDPVKALSEIALDLHKMATVNRSIRTSLRVFGKNFKTGREALEQGFRSYNPDGTLAFFKKKFPTPTGEKSFLAVAGKKKIYFPEEVIKAIDDFNARTKPSDSMFWRSIDNFTQTFKAFVTSVFPAFHFRNAMANRFQRYINEGFKAFKGADDLDAVRILANSSSLDTRFIKVGNSNISMRTVKEWAKRDGITSTNRFWVDIGGANFDSVPSNQLTGRISDWVTLNSSNNNFVKAGRTVGAAIEDQAKLASYVRSLKDGFSRAEATQIAFNGLFDYSSLTNFERTVMRRIFPFYTFGRKNLELQTRALLTNPGRQANIFKTVKDLQDDALKDLSDEQLAAFNELRPEFLETTFAIPVGQDKEGKIMWMTGFGLPQEDLLETFSAQGLGFRANPLAKGLLEESFRALNESQSIRVDKRYQLSEARLLFKEVFKDTPSKENFMKWWNGAGVTHPLRKLLDMHIVKEPKFVKGKVVKGEFNFVITANPTAINALRSSMIARHANTLKQLGDPNVEGTQFLMRFLTGMGIFRQDMEQSARFEVNKFKNKARFGLERGGAEGAYKFGITAAGKQAPPNVKRLVKRLNKKLRLK